MDSFNAPRSYRYHIILFSLFATILLFTAAIIVTWQDDSHLKNTLILCLLTSCLTFSFILFRAAQKFLLKYQRFTNILCFTPEPLYIKDNKGKFSHVNKAMASLYELSIDEMIGKTEQQLSEEQRLTIIKEDTQQKIVKNNQHYLLSTIKFKTLDNREYTFASAKDVTELTRTKNESQKNQNKLQCVLDVSEEGLWEYNLLTNQCHFDIKCSQIFGFNNANYVFDDFENSIFLDDKNKVSTAITKLIESDQTFNMEYRIQKPDGEIRWIWDRGIITEYDEQNQPLVIVGIVQDITQDKLNQDKIHNLAYYDPLTSLPNRILASQHLEKAINLSVKQQSFSTMLLLNIDRFKVINDSYGHQMGDQLLIEVAKRIQLTLQPEDFIGRFSGDEFVIIINQLGVDTTKVTNKAKKIAKKIKDILTLPIILKLKEPTPTTISYYTTISIGGVIFKTNSHDEATLIKLSDVALHKVKMRGGNDYMIVNPTLQNELNQMADMYKSLSCAIDEDELSLHYQPQYNIEKKMVGAEALLRWNSDKFGMVSPVKFIPIAEDSNLIIEIGYWVLTLACKQLKSWQEDPQLKHLRLSVNLSSKQIWQEDFIFLAKNIIRHYDIDSSKLTFEITESILIRDVPDTIRKLNALKELGALISLDDFGTGYSSLSYLKNFPIDEIKIDRSFVQYINSNQSDLIMAKAIIDLGKNFNLTVVSEGIEDEDQLNTLIKLGGNRFQGFLLNRPLPIEQFLEAAYKET